MNKCKVCGLNAYGNKDNLCVIHRKEEEQKPVEVVEEKKPAKKTTAKKKPAAPKTKTQKPKNKVIDKYEDN